MATGADVYNGELRMYYIKYQHQTQFIAYSSDNMCFLLTRCALAQAYPSPGSEPLDIITDRKELHETE